MVHKLNFDDNFVRYLNEGFVNDLPSNYERFLQFVDRVMVLHKAPVIEILKFKVGLWCNTEDMALWIRIGIVRCVRQLEISHSVEYYEEYDQHSIILPRSLYMCAKLEVLKLTNTIVLDVPTAVCLPSLKSLHLLCVEYKTDECHCRLLSGCPVLEELVVDKSKNISLPCFYVVMPSLERLSICDTWVDDFASKVVINAPSLKYLNIVDPAGNDISCLSENMPKMAEANVNVSHQSPDMVMRSLTSVKRLSLCLSLSASMVIKNNLCVSYDSNSVITHVLMYFEILNAASATYCVLSACSSGAMCRCSKVVGTIYLDARKFSKITSSQAHQGTFTVTLCTCLFVVSSTFKV